MSSQQRPDPLSELSEVVREKAINDIHHTRFGWMLHGCDGAYHADELRWIAEELDYRNAEETET